MERENGVAVVPLEDFDPEALVKETPEEVELRDGATYIVLPRKGKNYEQAVSTFIEDNEKIIKSMELVLDVEAVAEIVQPETDKLLKGM